MSEPTQNNSRKLLQPIARRAGLIIAIVAFALLARVVYVLIAPQVDPILRRDPLYGDASGYHLLAVNLLHGLGLTWDGVTPTSYRMPGYPALVASVYAFLGDSLQIIRLLQAILGALTCFPIYLIGERLGGWKLGALSACGIAFHPILVYTTAWVYSETLFIFLMWLGIWVMIRAITNPIKSSICVAGVLLGFSVLVRSEIAWFPLALAALLAVFRSTRAQVPQVLVVQIILLITVMPWAVRNYFAQGRVVLFATATGSTLFGGNNPQADGGMAKDQVFVLPNMTEVQSDQALTQRAVEWIATHPTEFLRLLPLKALRFFSPADMKTDSSPLGRWATLVNGAYALFLIVATRGVWVNRKQPIALVLCVVIAWYLLLALVFSGGTRVALPIAPALVILAACGLASVRSVRNRVWSNANST